MPSIKFDLKMLTSYLQTNNTELSKEDIAQINSIFTRCDTCNEKGEKIADGLLTDDEVPAFQMLIQKELSNFSGALTSFINNLAGVKKDENLSQIQHVKSHRTDAEIEIYKAKVEEAKSILLEKAVYLGLSAEEVRYIESIDYESIKEGAARYDSSKDKIWFNTNDYNTADNVYGFIKIIMHEVTHGVLHKTEYNNKQEIACEKRAIEVVKKLYDNMSDREKEENNLDFLSLLKSSKIMPTF